MTTVAPEETTQDPAAEPVHDDAVDHEGHPSDWQYIQIAIILAVLTALEVFTYFESVHSLGRNALIFALVVMMIIKIALVVGYFMHLKFDNVMFTRMFMAGVLLALGVYLVMLTTFLIWD